jgi:hypothetical protein
MPTPSAILSEVVKPGCEVGEAVGVFVDVVWEVVLDRNVEGGPVVDA